MFINLKNEQTISLAEITGTKVVDASASDTDT